MLWASGTGAEVIKPMAAPVLGGILIADEVIDLFLPVLFYWVRRARWQRLHSGAHLASGNSAVAAADDYSELSSQPAHDGFPGFSFAPANVPTTEAKRDES
jgi:hypothetical protein